MRFPRIPAALTAALPLALACGDGSPAGPVDDVAVVETISEAEILGTAGLEDLTDEERTAVRAALHEARMALLEVRAAFRAGRIDRAGAIARARAIHEALLERLAEILSEEELARLLDRRHPLGLTDEQAAAIRALRERFRVFVADRKAKVESGELTAEEARADVRAAARNLRAAICGILSAGQRARAPFCRPGGAGG